MTEPTTTATPSTAAEDLTRALTTLEGDPATIATVLVDTGWKSPDDVNAINNQATAYNDLLLRLAVALGWATETTTELVVDPAEVIEAALSAIATTTTVPEGDSQ